MRLRLTIATEFLPESDAGEITGGVEAYCHYVGRELESEHDVTFVGQRTTGASHDTATVGTLLGRVWFAARAVVGVVRSSPDVVIGTNFVTHPAVWLGGRLRRAKVVFWYPDVLIGHWTDGSFGRGGAVFEFLERVILRLKPDLYIAITETVAEKLRAQGADSDRIVVIPCGYDPTEVDAIIAETLQTDGRIAVVGRLVSYKRVDLVVRALAQLPDRHDQVGLTIIGKGPERSALEKLAGELDVGDRVEFTGHLVQHRDALATMASARIFVSASEIEGFGIVVAEAMALGRPYVVSDIDVFVEVTGNGMGGLFFEKGDATHLARQLTRLLDDDVLYARSAAAGVEWARRYTWPDIARRTSTAIVGLADR